jgi:hypothetical protein
MLTDTKENRLTGVQGSCASTEFEHFVGQRPYLGACLGEEIAQLYVIPLECFPLSNECFQQMGQFRIVSLRLQLARGGVVISGKAYMMNVGVPLPSAASRRAGHGLPAESLPTIRAGGRIVLASLTDLLVALHPLARKLGRASFPVSLDRHIRHGWCKDKLTALCGQRSRF